MVSLKRVGTQLWRPKFFKQVHYRSLHRCFEFVALEIPLGL